MLVFQAKYLGIANSILHSLSKVFDVPAPIVAEMNKPIPILSAILINFAALIAATCLKKQTDNYSKI